MSEAGRQIREKPVLMAGALNALYGNLAGMRGRIRFQPEEQVVELTHMRAHDLRSIVDDLTASGVLQKDAKREIREYTGIGVTPGYGSLVLAAKDIDTEKLAGKVAEQPVWNTVENLRLSLRLGQNNAWHLESMLDWAARVRDKPLSAADALDDKKYAEFRQQAQDACWHVSRALLYSDIEHQLGNALTRTITARATGIEIDSNSWMEAERKKDAARKALKHKS